MLHPVFLYMKNKKVSKVTHESKKLLKDANKQVGNRYIYSSYFTELLKMENEETLRAESEEKVGR